MANSITFDGTDMAGSSYGLFVSEFNEPWAPKPNVRKERPALGENEFHTSNPDDGGVSLNVYIIGTSTSDLRTKRDNILILLDSRLGPKILTIDAISSRQVYAIRTSAIPAPQLGDRVTKFRLDFEFKGPVYSTTEESNSFSIITDPDTFDIESGPTAVAGTDYAQPVWYIRNSTGGAVTSVTLNVTTMVESLTWTGSLDDGEWLRIGSVDAAGRFLYTLDKSTTSGADPTVLTYTDEKAGASATAGDWPRLKHNTANSATVTGISTGTVQWVYRARYQGM